MSSALVFCSFAMVVFGSWKDVIISRENNKDIMEVYAHLEYFPTLQQPL